MQKLINKLLHNKLVLYAILVFTMVTIFGYMMTGCIYTVAFFAVTTLINSMFTKNMILILGGSLFLTNTFMMCKVIKEGFSCTTEGFQGKEGLEIKTPLGSVKTGSKKSSSSDSSSSKITEKECKKKKDHTWKNDKCVANKKESMTTAYKKNDNYIDHAATVSQAYGGLEDILGPDGISGLTKDTQALVEQQKKMMNMMNNMGPMVDQVKGMMDSMGGSDGMQKMLGAFSGNK